jgi:tetratricopeptide (TPR) repeat protein
MSNAACSQEAPSLAGVCVAFMGRLSGMSRREAQRLVRKHGGTTRDNVDATVDVLVVGDETGGTDPTATKLRLLRQAKLDELTRKLISRGEIEVISETELWRRIGLAGEERDVQSLYTVAMLAQLLKVDATLVRRWQRRGWIRPARVIRRLAYFNFEQLLVARRLAALLSSGVTPAALERRLGEWAQHAPEYPSGLADYAVVAGGRHLLRRIGDSLYEASGQRWFSFVDQAAEKPRLASSDSTGEQTEILPLAKSDAEYGSSPEALLQIAEDLEDQGELAAATDLYRAALAAGGPNADACFAMAEIFYRLGDLSAARERYFMAIELDENFVEARANLGCLLAEQGRLELAAAAFEGALRYHPDYADAHYHLARTLCDLERREDARPHWEAFLRLAPDSPWAVEVRLLMELADGPT